MIIEQQQRLQARQVLNDRATAKLPKRVEQLIAELERMTANALRRKDYSSALRSITARLQCLKTIGELSGELRPGGAGEFVPGNAAAAASVVVNMPTAPEERTEDFLELIRAFYSLPPKVPAKTEPIM